MVEEPVGAKSSMYVSLEISLASLCTRCPWILSLIPAPGEGTSGRGGGGGGDGLSRATDVNFSDKSSTAGVWDVVNSLSVWPITGPDKSLAWSGLSKTKETIRKVSIKNIDEQKYKKSFHAFLLYKYI